MSNMRDHEMAEEWTYSPERSHASMEMLLRRLAFEVDPSIQVEAQPCPGVAASYSILMHGERKELVVWHPFLLAYGRALRGSSRPHKKQQSEMEKVVRQALHALLPQKVRQVEIKELSAISRFPRE